MSLVAYGASDDSEESGTESQQEEEERDVPISDDDEEFHHKSNADPAASSSTSDFFKSTLLDIGTKQDLPPPSKTEEYVIEEAELEQEVRQKPSELADAPKPPPKRTKQPVKITIPSLNDISDDDDGDNKQKPVASSVRSGLFSLLPAPIHSAKKEINRPLIPHSLGKKVAAAKPANVQKPISSSSTDNKNVVTKTSAGSINKTAVIQNTLIGYGSDSDDDDDDHSESNTPQNFFSLSSSNKTTDKSSETVKEAVKAAVEEKSDGDKSERKTAISPTQEDEIATRLEPGLTNNSPLSFSNTTRFSAWSSASSNYLGGLRPMSHQPPVATSSHYSSYPHETSVQYNMADAQDTEHDPISGTDDDLQKVLNDKEKLNGKRKRGMDEAISFVDAKVDDYVDPSELSKHVTEESEYAPKKNKDDMPTSQQKRKKQITYLAFQAKEKELELKNTWSQNKLTRRQTQAKYGF